MKDIKGKKIIYFDFRFSLTLWKNQIQSLFCSDCYKIVRTKHNFVFVFSCSIGPPQLSVLWYIIHVQYFHLTVSLIAEIFTKILSYISFLWQNHDLCKYSIFSILRVSLIWINGTHQWLKSRTWFFIGKFFVCRLIFRQKILKILEILTLYTDMIRYDRIFLMVLGSELFY